MAPKPAWANAPGVTLIKHCASDTIWVHGSTHPLVGHECQLELLRRGQHTSPSLQSHFDTTPELEFVHYFTETLDHAAELEMAFLEHYFDQGRLLNEHWSGLF